MILKRPKGRHRAYRLLHRVEGRLRTFRHPELTAVNQEVLQGRIDLDRAYVLVKAIADRYRAPKRQLGWNEENMRLAEAYWEARIKPKRKNVAPGEAKRRVFWGIAQLRATSILTATEEELYQALKHLKPSPKKKAASVINAVLRWRGLEKCVQVERVPRQEPAYLTLAELLSFSLPRREWQLCVLTAFATGCRYGELFTINQLSLREEGSHVYIRGQIKRDMGIHETKNRKVGSSYIVLELRAAVAAWAAVAPDVKLAMRAKGVPGEEFKEAAFKALRRDGLNFHKLRHSYARCMLTRNEGIWDDRDAATLEDLRQWMRDQLSTIEYHYASWVVTSSQMRSNVRRFG